MARTSKDPLDDPKVVSLIHEVVASGKVDTGDLSLEYVGRHRVGKAEYGILEITRRNSEISKKLEASLSEMNALLRKHNVHQEVVHSIARLLNLLHQARLQEKEALRQERLRVAALPGAIISAEASSRAASKHAKNPAHVAMTEIRKEFDRWQDRAARYDNDAAFAAAMHAKYAHDIKNEGSIKNACARWRRERKSSC